ncbi:Hypothetical protein Cp1002B_1168 [Corynebacterium pseudotuberculosis]|nr:Hypothetical protein Cp1002B_1168 [Corynebacterium pseudotuberculosis]ALP34156.1 Hypothetical protein CpN1_1482 [Corynebacterium pseudotuberculosis]ALR34093.1 Hypothetical protein CpPA01_1433 [Corynebacterium pseudotuberculosis]ANK56859.1 Hypothetical protein CpPA02_1449 [Corynebacterium pseudotuberculosis]APZ32208.1 Hypothetical protein CpMEX1_1480 [Corynebacterium pseudotuberculosis]
MWRMSQPISRILYPLFKKKDGDHPSGRTIAGRLKQLPTDSSEQLSNIRAGILKEYALMPCSQWGLPSQASHLACWCALTAPFHPYPEKSRRSTFCCTCPQVTLGCC